MFGFFQMSEVEEDGVVNDSGQLAIGIFFDGYAFEIGVCDDFVASSVN